MRAHLSNIEKLNFISNMQTMLAAGIPLADTVETMLTEVKGSQKKILTTLRDDINQGKKISESFEKFPDAFDSVIVHLLGAAEEAGTLDETLKDLTETIRRDIEFNDKVRSALTYPFIVICVFVAILLIMLVFVIPRITEVFVNLKVPLPLPTRVLIFMSNTFLTYMPFVIGGLVLFIVGTAFLYKQNKKALIKIIYSLPLFKGLAREIDFTRFTRSFALLLNSGIPIFNAMELAEQVVVKKEISDMLKHAKEVVASGKNLSEAFREYPKLVPGMVIRVTQAGERTGSLSKSMQDLSEYFDKVVSKKVKDMTTLLEPLMLVLIAALVGGMMLAVIAPIYGLIGQIQVSR